MRPLIVALSRGDLPESEHEVAVAVWRRGEVVARAGAVGDRVFLRSAAKPVQALAVVRTGGADQFAFSPAELAIACGSHGGEPFHVETAAGVLARIGCSAADLLCGAHPPAFAPAARALNARSVEPGPLHNNCSGKHAAMLAACVAAGWPIANYVDPEHPLQQMNRRHVGAYTGRDPDSIQSGIDGCSVPTFQVSVAEAATMFARWTSPAVAPDAKLADAAARIMDALAAHPEMIGGTERLDTDVIAATSGRVVCKVGAEGMWCAGVRDGEFGIAVQCRDGASRASYAAGMAVLRRLGVFDDSSWQALASHHDPIRRNHRQLDVGRIDVHFPDGFPA